MSSIRSLALLALLCLGFSTPVGAEEPLPNPPEGFTWQRMPSIHGALLRPDGWFYNEGKQAGTDGFFVTKEDAETGAGFTTGVSVFCVRDIPTRMGKSPTAYASQYADVVATKHELLDRSSKLEGPFTAVRFRFVEARPAKDGQESLTKSQLIIGNDKTGTAFLVVFQAPTASWAEAWKTGEVILKRLVFDDGI